MTTTDERQRPVEPAEVDAYVDLVDTDPVPLVEAEDEDGWEQRAAEHLGDDDPHDEADVLDGVELSEGDD